MLSKWDNQIGRRNRKPIAVLVTEDGNIHRFTGESIPGVCSAIPAEYCKQGKWSYQAYEITHRPSTTFLSWHEDWETGLIFPQTSWEAAFVWIAQQAPGVSIEGLKSFVNEWFEDTAARWDERSISEGEFSAPLPLVHAEESAALVAKLVPQLRAEEQLIDDVQSATSRYRKLTKEYYNIPVAENPDPLGILKAIAESSNAPADDLGSGAFDCIKL